MLTPTPMRLKWDEEAVATIDYPMLEVVEVSAEEGALLQYNIRRRFEAVQWHDDCEERGE